MKPNSSHVPCYDMKGLPVFLTLKTVICREWNQDLIEIATEKLRDDVHIFDGASGGKEAYRNTLAVSLFFKFYTSVANNHEHIKVGSAFDSLTHQFNTHR